MSIAIIGAGFCGLATAWHLLQKRPSLTITIFDEVGIGGGASGMAAGLMHPFAGAHAKLNFEGHLAFSSACTLLAAASKALGNLPVADQRGFLRLALSETQKKDFAECAKKHQMVKWMSPQQCQELVPHVAFEPGIWIEEAAVVNCPLYLQGLWKACEEQGAQFEKVRIENLQQLAGFDNVILAVGAAIAQMSDLRVCLVKGQLLELTWPEKVPSLPYAINSQAYLVMHPNGRSCFAGSTFERGFKSCAPNVEVARQEILPKAFALFPPLERSSIIDCKAGVRVSTPNHLPLIARIDPRTWAITGMGSKGLLYHALFAKRLADTLLDH